MRSFTWPLPSTAEIIPLCDTYNRPSCLLNSISVIGPFRPLSTNTDRCPFWSDFSILGIGLNPPYEYPASVMYMLPLSSNVTVLGRVRFQRTGSILYPGGILNISTAGGLLLEL